jgi:hypothetical protein
MDHPAFSTILGTFLSPITVADKSKGRILIGAPPYPEKGYVAAGQYGSGENIALGQSPWWNWIGRAQYKDSDNQQLLLSLVANTSEQHRAAHCWRATH